MITGSIADDQISLLDDTEKGGWQFFGFGILDSGFDNTNNEIVIDVDWNSSNWGIGGMYDLGQPIDGRKIKEIRIKVKTDKGTETKIFGGFSTPDDANISIDSNMAFEIIDQWQIISLPVSHMRPTKPSKDSPNFSDDDWSKIQITKILFLKPKSPSNVQGKIYIKDPELILKEPVVYSKKIQKAEISQLPKQSQSPADSNLKSTSEQKKIIRESQVPKNGENSLNPANSESQKKKIIAESNVRKNPSRTQRKIKRLVHSIEKKETESAYYNDKLLDILNQINSEIDKSRKSKTQEEKKAINRRIVSLDKKSDKLSLKITQLRKSLYENKQELTSEKQKRGVTDDKSLIMDKTDTSSPSSQKRRLVKRRVYTPLRKKLKDENEFENLYQETLTPGDILYNKTIQLAEKQRKIKSPARDISNSLLKGAGNCRDKGEYKYALVLFEKAIAEDPENAYAFRIYGDFLMGYRGQYEKAATKYAQASKLLEDSPDSYNDKFRKSLARSIKIHHRDGKDGVPVLQAESFSIYLDGAVSYMEPSVNKSEPLSMFEQQLSAERFANNEKKKKIPRQLATRREEAEYESRVLLRFKNEKLPYFRLKWSQKDIKTINVNPENPQQRWDGIFKSVSLLAGKNYILSDDFDLNLEAEISDRIISTDDSKIDNQISREDSDVLELTAKFKHYFDTNTMTVTIGGTWAEIGRIDGRLPTVQDSLNTQRVSLRYSFYKPPEETENPARFQGRRSDHFEIGLKRSEREFHRGTFQYTYEPHISYEMLGLVNGQLDLMFKGKAYQRRYSDTFKKGTYNAFEFGFTPIWYFIYDLYENDFITGHEYLTLGFPLQVTFDEQLGSYSRVNAAIELEDQWVTDSGTRFQPKLSVDYAYYPHIRRDDWGVFAKCGFRY